MARVVYLETPRLRLGQLTPDDLDALFQLDQDPEVMRYLGGRSTPFEDVRDRALPAMLAFHAKGPDYGFWAAEDRATDAFLGWFHFRPPHDADVPGIELGYRLARAAWGQGLATEGSRAIIARGFGELGVKRICAKTLTTNLASRRVMEKCGLAFEREFMEHRLDPPAPAVWYAITRDAWRPPG